MLDFAYFERKNFKMLSYRHGFHAGNHADVLKHMILLILLDYLQQKDKGLLLLDTHSGAGKYDLNSDFAQKNQEFANGALKLWNMFKNQALGNADDQNIPQAVQRYLQALASCQTDDSGELRFYPGSPWLLAQAARRQDYVHCCELHPSDFAALDAALPSKVTRHQADGFDVLKALLPPPSRRACVLIDPSYEEKRDYLRVIEALKLAIKTFKTGTYALWYPCLHREASKNLPKQLKQLSPQSFLRAELWVEAARQDFGMFGSGMFIINPPWILPEVLRETLPFLSQHLGARFELDVQLP